MKLVSMKRLSSQLQSLLLISLLGLMPGSSSADNRIQSTTGFIAAVGVETDEQGHPMLAEYDSDGYLVGDIGYLGLGQLEGVSLYPAASWRAFQLFQQTLINDNPVGTAGARLISAEQYNSTPYKVRTDATQTINKPDLRPGTRSVFVIAEDKMLNADPGKAGFILAEYPIALHNTDTGITDSTVTLILNPQGEIIRTSNFDISFKASVYKEGGRQENDGNERLWQPIPNVMVTTPFSGGLTTSEEDGRYSMTYALPACPGFSYEIDVPITATIDIENFNPKASGLGFMSATRDDLKVCVGYGDALSINPFAAAAQLEAQAIIASLAVPIYNLDLKFSTMQLNAIGTLSNQTAGENLNPVRLSNNTVYTDNSQVNPLQANEYQFDFNLDGDLDIAVINPTDPTQIDIYYSPNQPTNELGESNEPDFTRVADNALLNQLDHQGLLSDISQTDLEDTDIYIYRRSTGQRLGVIEGLAKKQTGGGGDVINSGNVANPTGRATYRGVHTDESNATFGFTSLLVGAISNDATSDFFNEQLSSKTNRRPWGDTKGVTGGFTTDNPPDSLRPGETIQIIAINRATGYIGTQAITTQPSGTTLEPPTPIQMGPPNLKVIASREFKDFNELTRNTDKKINIIGSEGAGLTSDTYVKIQTVWLSQNGDVLPDDLPGYTGRVAISTGSSTTDFSGNFEIRPGYQTQLVQLNNANELTKEHFYVQVVGEHFKGNPVFESPGAGEGKLQTRPKKYVPVLVPLFDEASTRVAKQALAIAKLDGIQDLPEQVDPSYRWTYRPEMQFSVYELIERELQLQFSVEKDENGDDILQIIDLADVDQNIFNDILNQVSYIELLYDLEGPENNSLELFGADQQLTLSIGAEEVEASVGSNGIVRFDQLDHLNFLTTPDYLTISLFQNNDAANALWEWAFLANIYFVNEMGEKVSNGASFSHPNPVVQIGTGMDQDEIKITDLSVSGNTATVSFNGKVFCDIADITEDPRADINKVTILVPKTHSTGGYERIEVSVTNTSSVELKDYLPFDLENPPERIEDEPHPYVGEFNTTVDVELVSGSVTVLVEVENAIGNTGYDSFTITTDNQGDNWRVVKVENNVNTDRGLFRPIWMQLEDPLLDSNNIVDAKITLLGQQWPVVERDGFYYANRAFIQLGREFLFDINADNIANVTQQVAETESEYETPSDRYESEAVKTNISWSYTTVGGPNSSDDPINYFKYASGTTIGVEWRDSLLNEGWLVDSAKVYEKNGYTWLLGGEEDLDSKVVGHKPLAEQDGRKGVRFAVQLDKAAHKSNGTLIQRKSSRKRMEIVLKKDDKTKIVNSGYFGVTPLKTVILAVDGLAYSTAKELIGSSGSPNFKKIFGNGKVIGDDEPALSALPTITWANWPGVFSGGPPSEHGWLGNSYFPRESTHSNIPGQLSNLFGGLKFPVFSAGQDTTDLGFQFVNLDYQQQIGVALGGVPSGFSFEWVVKELIIGPNPLTRITVAANLANAYSMDDRSTEEAGSLYDIVADELNKTEDDPLNVHSVKVFYDRAGDKVDKRSVYFSARDPFGHSAEAAAGLDNGEANERYGGLGSGPKAREIWNYYGEELDIMSIYLPGTDNAGHTFGDAPNLNFSTGVESDHTGEVRDGLPIEGDTGPVNVSTPPRILYEHASTELDDAIGKLIEKIESRGEQNAVLFAMTADHGQHTFRNKQEFVFLTEDAKKLFEVPAVDGGMGMEFWNGENYNSARAVYSPNGAFGQFYLRAEGEDWQDPPDRDDVLKLAGLLYRESKGHENYNSKQLLCEMAKREKGGECTEFELNFGDQVLFEWDEANSHGIYGETPAIFVRVSDNGGNHFIEDYRWVKGVTETANPLVDGEPQTYSYSVEPDNIFSIDEFIADSGKGSDQWPALKERIEELNHKNARGSRSGDVITILNGEEGHLTVNNVDEVYAGWHGGPTKSESEVPLFFSILGNSFSDDAGNLVAKPPELAAGHIIGKGASNIKSDGYLRNWHMSHVLKKILKEFRDE